MVGIFDREIIVLRVHWYLRCKLGLRDLVEMMAVREMIAMCAPRSI
jgi:transposase-like protein